MQITEIIAVTDGATDTRHRRIQSRNDNRVVIGNEIDHPNNAITTGHAHVHLYTIDGTLVNRNQIIGLVNGVCHHLSRNELILAKKLQLLTLYHCGIVCSLRIETTQLVHLSFQIEIA